MRGFCWYYDGCSAISVQNSWNWCFSQSQQQPWELWGWWCGVIAVSWLQDPQGVASQQLLAKSTKKKGLWELICIVVNSQLHSLSPVDEGLWAAAAKAESWTSWVQISAQAAGTQHSEAALVTQPLYSRSFCCLCQLRADDQGVYLWPHLAGIYKQHNQFGFGDFSIPIYGLQRVTESSAFCCGLTDRKWQGTWREWETWEWSSLTAQGWGRAAADHSQACSHHSRMKSSFWFQCSGAEAWEIQTLINTMWSGDGDN